MLLTPDLLKPNQILTNQTKLIICYCAAWCRTCDQYKPDLNDLSERFTDWSFLWVDIEDHPELLIDDDIEDFPTVLIQDHNKVLFLGTLLPHIDHLEKLILNADQLPALDIEPITLES